MKKAAIVVAVISLALAGSAFAVDSGKPQTFDQKKASTLKMLNDRMNKTQEAQNCVQASKIMDDLKTCRKNYMDHLAEMEKMEKAK